MSNKVNQHVILKVDQHRRSCTRHRHQRGQMCCELWCTTVHQGVHSQVSCPTFSDTIRFTMNVCIHLHCGLSVFRIGRTARAGKAGLAFTFLLGVQVKHIYIITHWWERQMIRINSGPNKMFLCHPQEKTSSRWWWRQGALGFKSRSLNRRTWRVWKPDTNKPCRSWQTPSRYSLKHIQSILS